jgi:hypothetical protein
MKRHPYFKNYNIFEEEFVRVKLEPPPNHVPMTKERFDYIVQNQQKWRSEYQEMEKVKNKEKNKRINEYNKKKRLEMKKSLLEHSI